MQTNNDARLVYGVAEQLRPMLRCIVAPNPSPMTYHGTNTYLLGDRGLAVIDPGPNDVKHLDAILNNLRPQEHISHIIVTHAHMDHSPLAKQLSELSGAKVFGFGAAQHGRSAIMQELVHDGVAGGGEGVDTAFAPDIAVSDGEMIEGDGWTLRVIHTPGHIGNHICLAWGDTCFTADHVMGWSSSLISPPDGDLTDFMASCRKLQKTSWTLFFPGHGPVIKTPAERLNWLIAHRMAREKAILEALSTAPGTVQTLTRAVYTETPEQLLPAAERNVLAHLIDLWGKDMVACMPKPGPNAIFKRTSVLE